MQFTHTLLTWYDENKRPLPWRGERDPYKQVLRLWQGLGYYTRARNLYAAAQQIVTLHGGVFPDRYDDIRALKGVGDYTAAAIASIAFGLPHPAVDGNVLRVVSRIFGIRDDIAAPATRRQITERCAQLIDPDRPGSFNQAMMELGAIQCLPKNPKCDECPFQHECFACTHGLTVPLQETESDCTLESGHPVAELREVLTHQIIHAKFYLKETKKAPKTQANQIIVPLEQLDQYPKPKIIVQFLSKHLL